MSQHVHAFIQSAAQTFEFRGPVYEFSYWDNSGPEPVSPQGGSAREKDRQPPKAPVTFPLLADEDEEAGRLEDLGRLPFPDRSARTVICTGALEHAARPRQAVTEMIRILRPGGILLVCSELAPKTSECPDHGWHPTPEALQRLFGKLAATLIGWQGAQQSPHTVFGIGCKAPVPGEFIHGANRFLDRFQGQIDEAAARIGWRRKLWRFLSGCVRSQDERRKQRDYHKANFILHLPVDRRLKSQLLGSCLPQQETGTRLDLSQ